MSARKKNKPIDKKLKKPSSDVPDRLNAESNIRAAHDQAEKDIQQDADLSIHSANDDLDEAESARLGGDKNDLI
jgi:hypothetical protein